MVLFIVNVKKKILSKIFVEKFVTLCIYLVLFDCEYVMRPKIK